MVRLKVTIHLKSPLLAGDARPGPYEQRTSGYLPGATLRGALGARLVAECGHSDHEGSEGCDYARVFSGPLPARFGPCYPAADSMARPFPATARTCKHYPGLLDSDDEDKHGVRDGLIAMVITEAQINSGEPVFEKRLRCEHCGADLEPIGGFYETAVDKRWYQPRLWMQRFSRTAIDRARGTAADELLYTLEVISERMASGRRERNGRENIRETQLMGWVWVDKSYVDLMTRRLQEVKYLGGDTGRGLGLVRVEARTDDARKDEITLDQIVQLAAAVKTGAGWDAVKGPGLVWRVGQFNRALHAAHGEAARWPTGSLFFCVDLLSDTIWPDGGLPTNSLPGELYGAKLVRGFSSAKVTSGWNVAAGTMRPPQQTVMAGSVFLYQIDDTDNPVKLGNLLAALARLESDGAGDERERGYGWVEICSPFHLEVNPK